MKNETANVQLQTVAAEQTAKPARARTASKKGENKTAPAVAAKAEPTIAMRTIRYHANPYQAFADYGKGFFRGYTIAAMVAAGMAKIVGEAISQTKGAPVSTLRAVIGQTAYTHWKGAGRIEVEDGIARLTAAGMNEISASLAGTSKYPTAISTVKGFTEAMAGTAASVEIEGRKIVLGQTISVRA